MSARGSVAVVALVASLFGASEAAQGQTVETVIPDFIVSCTSTGELCDPPFFVSVETGSVLQVQYFVRPTHCGSVRVGLLVDGTLEATSDFLGWPGAPAPFSELALDTGLVDLGPVSPGAHVVGVQAEGQVGGCNTGQLDNWGGSLRVLTSPPVAQVPIDIKPGSFPNSINPRSRGKIPVAILTTDRFDATTVSPTTVRFGPTGSEAAPVHSALADVDRDGDIDLILQFKTQGTGIKCGDVSARLTGKTFGGQAVEGSDSIRTVGCK
jgi:hypothetical protein